MNDFINSDLICYRDIPFKLKCIWQSWKDFTVGEALVFLLTDAGSIFSISFGHPAPQIILPEPYIIPSYLASVFLLAPLVVLPEYKSSSKP